MIKIVFSLLFSMILVQGSSQCLTGDCWTGSGKYLYKSGNTYEGEFLKGKRDGEGTMKITNGNIYNGSFKNNKYDGNGTMKYHNNKQYNGSWKKGVFNGNGTFSWPSGKKYEGQFKNGKFNGEGKMRYENGYTYVGSYSNNKKNGKGVLYNSDKKVYKSGKWVNGELVVSDLNRKKRKSSRKNKSKSTGKSLADMVEEYEKSVVFIMNFDSEWNYASMGTGFVVGDHKIMTNAHVVEGANNLAIQTVDGKIFFADKLLVKDNDCDVATFRVMDNEKFGQFKEKPLKMSRKKNRKGDKIFVIGNPKGYSWSVSEGIVSSFRPNEGAEIVQITAPVSSGSSGSPVFNTKGHVIAIATMINISDDAQNLNFAYSVSNFRKYVD